MALIVKQLACTEEMCVTININLDLWKELFNLALKIGVGILLNVPIMKLFF